KRRPRQLRLPRCRRAAKNNTAPSWPLPPPPSWKAESGGTAFPLRGRTMSAPPPADPSSTSPGISVLAVVLALARVIRETLNTPAARGFLGPVLPQKIDEALMIPLGSLLEAPGLDQVNLAGIAQPQPLLRVAVALRDARAAIAAYPEAAYLQRLWRELLS